jgi:4-hydroxythreonine-4-phosphate dehydrogenase
VLVGDAAFLSMTASLIDPAIRLSAMSTLALRHSGLPHFGPGVIPVIDVPLAAHVVPGQLDAANGRAVLATLDLAIEGVRCRLVRRHRHRAAAEEHHQRCRHRVFRPHRIPGREDRHAKVVMMLAGSPGDRRISRTCGWRWPPPTCL